MDDGFPPLIAALSCARSVPGRDKRADVDGSSAAAVVRRGPEPARHQRPALTWRSRAGLLSRSFCWTARGSGSGRIDDWTHAARDGPGGGLADMRRCWEERSALHRQYVRADLLADIRRGEPVLRHALPDPAAAVAEQGEKPCAGDRVGPIGPPGSRQRQERDHQVDRPGSWPAACLRRGRDARGRDAG